MISTELFVNDLKLRIASEKIASGIDELKSLGFDKDIVHEALQVQLDHAFKEE